MSPTTVSEIKSFVIDLDQDLLSDLQDRLARTRMPAWADGNWSAGTDPGYLSELLHFWQHSFEWRKQEQILNKFSHFKTEIAGIDIHYIHQRGKGPTPFPILLTHGYPPREWAQRFFNVRRWQEMPRGGHFAAMEEPELLAEDLRTWFRAFRTLQES